MLPGRPALIGLLGAVVVAHAVSGWGQPAELPSLQVIETHVPPRLQWNANSGYCGETSFISAGLHFGQYCSQFTARAIASPGLAQSAPHSQLLLGVNDTDAARRMRLRASAFYHQTQRAAHGFLDWVKSETLRGRIVIIGVFNDGLLLNEWTGRRDGDGLYDHIVPVLRFGTNASPARFRDRALPDDVVTISDNGLYGPFGTPPAYQFYYSFRVRRFRGTRREANRPRGPVYLLKKSPPNFGIAVEGVLDLDGVTIPVALTASRDDEPEMPCGSNVPPAPAPLTLTATVTIPDPSVAYTLYRYDDFDRVPVAGFNAAAASAVESWHIRPSSGDTFTVAVSTMTDRTVVFRAVPITAP